MKRLIGAFVFLCMLWGTSTAYAKDLYPWKSMQAGAHDASVASAVAQAKRLGVSARVQQEFATALRTGSCKQVTVRFGTVYSGMTFRDGVRPTRNELPESKQAWRCQLSDTTLDFYSGYPGACNNVGLNPIIPAVCRSTSEGSFSPGRVTVVPGFSVECGDCGITVPGVAAEIQPSETNPGLTLTCN